MRMDRYDGEEIDVSKKSRTDKNQELYTDVYLNNAYVDISEIEEAVDEENKETLVENVEIKPEIEVVPLVYNEKKYDINSLIEEAIENNNDNLKRSIEHTTEIDGIIKSINEAQKEKEQNSDKELLEFLMPENDTTTIVEPLDNVIDNTEMVDTSVIHKDEMSNEILEEMTEENEHKEPLEERESEMDDTFKDETKIDKKKIFIIGGVILVILIILGFLVWKKVIKF
ncbi:MAG: hypothetical protein IKN63_01970 [Bacilli bacterium]|nr:hypothetical protein [Bacilli bacterium]